MAFCAKCGSSIEQGGSFCSECGHPLKASIDDDIKTNDNADREIVAFDRNGVVLTDCRLIAGGETFAISAIASVACKKSPAPIKGPLIATGFGLLTLLMAWFDAAAGMGDYSKLGAVFGLVIMGFGIRAWSRRKALYTVTIRTASGLTQDIYSDTDKNVVEELTAALNQSMVTRKKSRAA